MFDPYFLDLMYVEFMKNFHIAHSNELLSVTLISASTTQPTTHSNFLDIMYVEFMKNFHIADSNELFSVTLISASTTQKRLFQIF